MKKKEKFYQSRNGKAILFFGFYLIFFIFLGIMFKNYRNDIDNSKKENSALEEELTINKLISLDNYNYNFEIRDNGDVITFNGTKNTVDYDDYEYKYFLKIANINQMIKKSKVISLVDNDGKYIIDNSEISTLLNTDVIKGTSMITVNCEEKDLIINLDLHEYFSKNQFEIVLKFTMGGVS